MNAWMHPRTEKRMPFTSNSFRMEGGIINHTFLKSVIFEDPLKCSAALAAANKHIVPYRTYLYATTSTWVLLYNGDLSSIKSDQFICLFVVHNDKLEVGDYKWKS